MTDFSVWSKSSAVDRKNQREKPPTVQPIHTTGSNIGRAFSLLSANAYDKTPGATIGKESLQNALDAVAHSTEPRIQAGSAHGIFRIADNGAGMSPEGVLTHFLRGFVSGKDGTESTGSFGLAKVALLTAPARWRLVTTQNGTTTTVDGARGQWADYAQAESITVDPSLAEQTLPGGLTLRIEQTGRDNGTEYWAEIDGALQAESACRQILGNLRNPEIRFTFIDPDAWGECKTPSDYQSPAVKTEPSLGVVRREAVVPGACVRLYYSDAKPRKQSSVAVTNRGMFQFQEWVGGLDAALPADLSVDVTPTVGPETADYPYTLSRDGLKGPAKVCLTEWLTGMVAESKRIESEALRQVKDSAKRLRGSHLKFLDMTGGLPAGLVDQICNSAPLAEYSKALRKAYDEAAELLGDDFKCEFEGIAFGSGTLAVHCARKVWFFPFALQSESTDKLSHAELAAGAFLHELAHCESQYEGESHARSMTFLAGRVSETVTNLKRALRRIFERQSGFADWLRSTAETVRAFENQEKVAAFVKE